MTDQEMLTLLVAQSHRMTPYQQSRVDRLKTVKYMVRSDRVLMTGMLRCFCPEVNIPVMATKSPSWGSKHVSDEYVRGLEAAVTLLSKPLPMKPPGRNTM